VDLASNVKHGADVRSLPFDPGKLAGFRVYQPNISLMRAVTAQAIAGSGKSLVAKPAPTASRRTTAARKAARSGTTATTRAAGRGAGDVVSLDNACR
jgi:hypothetical protein